MLFDYTINWLDRDFPQKRKKTRRYLDTETFVRISLTGLDHFFLAVALNLEVYWLKFSQLGCFSHARKISSKNLSYETRKPPNELKGSYSIIRALLKALALFPYLLWGKKIRPPLSRYCRIGFSILWKQNYPLKNMQLLVFQWSMRRIRDRRRLPLSHYGQVDGLYQIID